MTADGKIAKNSDHFPNWTSKEDKKMFAEVTKEHGAVIMGDKTFFTFPKPLSDRLNVVFTLLENPPETENVKWVTGEPEKVLLELKKMGYKSAVLGGGTYMNSQFLERKLIDEIWLTIEPKIFGDGLGVFSGDFNIDLKLLGVEKINENSVVVKYKVMN
ncbi:MAG: FolA [Candidatus Moranbacteria bacterium GW2011_GWC1_45_18]|nr:MAG: FolA [Candidatus Moranbacteria bacterium GW2011_GWC2_40_12]KKT32435.1 MAG: FolA [Candidatus Moranbacteria bacterium GW2011_GWF2_44_10]KKT99732.1 MAG: FolA [Candidatus Moranbacteria bacterium GW2011_GWC1_45_18]